LLIYVTLPFTFTLRYTTFPLPRLHALLGCLLHVCYVHHVYGWTLRYGYTLHLHVCYTHVWLLRLLRLVYTTFVGSHTHTRWFVALHVTVHRVPFAVWFTRLPLPHVHTCYTRCGCYAVGYAHCRVCCRYTVYVLRLVYTHLRWVTLRSTCRLHTRFATTFYLRLVGYTPRYVYVVDLRLRFTHAVLRTGYVVTVTVVGYVGWITLRCVHVYVYGYGYTVGCLRFATYHTRLHTFRLHTLPHARTTRLLRLVCCCTVAFYGLRFCVVTATVYGYHAVPVRCCVTYIYVTAHFTLVIRCGYVCTFCGLPHLTVHRLRLVHVLR